MEEGRLLKQLNSQIKKIKSEIANFKNLISNANKDISNFQKEVNSRHNILSDLNNQVANLTKKDEKKLILSEHALLRYLERIEDLDLQEIENNIINDTDIELVKKLGGNITLKKENFSLVIKDYVIVTIK